MSISRTTCDWMRATAHALAIAFAVSAANVAAQQTPGAGDAQRSAKASQVYFFDLPRQPLSKALQAYAKVSGQQIIFTEDLVAGREAAAIRGSFTAEDALQQLLKGTNLTTEWAPSGAVMIRRIAAASL